MGSIESYYRKFNTDQDPGFRGSHSCHYGFFQLTMVANSRKEHWGQIVGGTKTTIDDLSAAVKANITATFDITANDKDRVRVDVARNQGSVNDSRHYAGT